MLTERNIKRSLFLCNFFKFITTNLNPSEELQTVDYVMKDGTVVYRTCEAEKHRNVLQIGTADATLALKAAQNLIEDVTAIDINMGCPKHFSLSGGMGAALLSKPDIVKDILSTLQRNLNKPVTCKIRLKDNIQDTLDLVKLIEQTGVSALTVHGRTVAERPRNPAHWDQIKTISSALSIPVIANGDCFSYADMQKMKESTGASSVMIARAAMWNASVFRSSGPLPLHDIIKMYLRKAVDTDSPYQNTKYVVMEMLKNANELETEKGQVVVHSKSMQQICSSWDVSTQRQKINIHRDVKRTQLGDNPPLDEPQAKKQKSDLERDKLQ